jgi:Arc/MetJ family transcription regulator
MKARSIKLTPKTPMKSTIEIDSSLITNALQVTGLTAQQEVIELALNLLIQMKNQENLRALRGKLAWDGDLNRMRTDMEQ